MKTAIPGLRARMRQVDAWIAEAAGRAFFEEFRRMSVEQKLAYLKMMLPTVPLNHPERPFMERLIKRLESEPPDSLYLR